MWGWQRFMSVRRPYIKEGRILYVIRPDPFVPPPLATLLGHLILRPDLGVALILRSDPDLRGLAGVLGLTGAAAGALFWAAAGPGMAIQAVLQAPAGALVAGAAAIWALWLSVAVLLHGSGHLLGGVGRFHQALQVIGVALLAAPPLGLPAGWVWSGGVHPVALALLLPLLIPVVRVAYHLERQALKLLPGMAALAAALPAALLLVHGLALTGLFVGWIPVPFINL